MFDLFGSSIKFVGSTCLSFHILRFGDCCFCSCERKKRKWLCDRLKIDNVIRLKNRLCKRDALQDDSISCQEDEK